MANPTPIYKFVELSVVTDEAIEKVVNEWVGKGWNLATIHFAMRDGSHRPSMAFVAFIKAGDSGLPDLTEA